MADDQRTEVYDSVPDPRPDTIATPEGDNEQLPGQPLNANEPAVTVPRGSEPHSDQPIRDAQS